MANPNHLSIDQRNEAALFPLVSTWANIEKYLDAESVFQIAATCSTAQEMVREAETYSRPHLPHILMHQDHYNYMDRGKSRHFESSQIAEIKHSFMIVLATTIDGVARKVQIHFVFRYIHRPGKFPLERLGDRQFMQSYYPDRFFVFYDLAFSWEEDRWEKMNMDPFASAVSVPMREAISMCCKEMHAKQPIFFKSTNDPLEQMDNYCEDYLLLYDFQRRNGQRRNGRKRNKKMHAMAWKRK